MQKPSVYIKDQSPKKLWNTNFVLIFLFIKIAKNCFWSVQGKHFFLFLFLALKNQRIRSPCPGFKNLYKKKFSPDFRVRVTIFWGFATSEKATLSHEILELGSYNNLAQRRMMGSMFYASQNHSTLLCSPHFFGKLRKSEVPEPTQAAIKLLNWVGFGTGTRKLLLRL